MLGRDGDARIVAGLSNLQPTDAVVDIGCGPGTAARHAARRGATVTGVDPAAVMLRIARLLTRSRLCRYVEGAAENVPLPDGAASVVWTIASVHHWSDVDAGLAEIHRILRPGGRFVALEKHVQPGAQGLGSHGWTDERVAAFADRCRAHGFADVRVEHHSSGRRRTVSVAATAP
jgi:ubiquinone/menaquinone biosynthesis C-methylase UbiE